MMKQKKTICLQEIIQQKISLFNNVANKSNSIPISLEDWFGIYTKQHMNDVLECRRLYKLYKDGKIDKSVYQDTKAKLLPVITPSCLFNGERNSNNINHQLTGIMCLDIDNIANQETVEELKRKVINLPYCFLVAKSVSGYGFFAFIVYNKEHDFKGTFYALKRDFKHMGISIDSSCNDYTRARFMGYDENTLCKRLDSEIEIYDDYIVYEGMQETHQNNIFEDTASDMNDEDIMLLTKCIVYLVKKGYGKDGFQYSDNSDEYDYLNWLKDAWRLSTLENDEIGLKLFYFISQNGANFNSFSDVRNKFYSCRNDNNRTLQPTFYFSLCKKMIGSNWKEIISLS